MSDTLTDTTDRTPILCPGPASQAAWDEFDAQGPIPPGTPGWWRVWAGNVSRIRPGDLVMCKTAEDLAEAFLVEDVNRANPLRLGILVEGTWQSIGLLCPIVLLRQGTRNTLD